MPHEYEARLQFLENQLAEILRKLSQLQASTGVGGYVLPQPDISGAFYCPSIPLIAGGGDGLGDVFTGLGVPVARGAKIRNPYASATTAGRICTLLPNEDNSYTLYGQSCL